MFKHPKHTRPLRSLTSYRNWRASVLLPTARIRVSSAIQTALIIRRRWIERLHASATSPRRLSPSAIRPTHMQLLITANRRECRDAHRRVNKFIAVSQFISPSSWRRRSSSAVLWTDCYNDCVQMFCSSVPFVFSFRICILYVCIFIVLFLLFSFLVFLLWPPYVIGQTIIFLPCDFYLSSSSFFFSSPNLSGRRLDVYHTSTHGVALVRI